MARNLENSTSENSNIQEMGPRRSTRLNVTISGVDTTTTRLHHGNHTGGHYDNHPRRGPWHQSYDPSHVIPSPRQTGLCRPNPTRAQCVAELSPSLALTCATRRAAHSRGPSLLPPSSPLSCGPACCSRQQPTPVAQPAPNEQPTPVAQLPPAAYSRQAACSRGPACSISFPSSPSRPKTISTIQTYHRAGGIFTTLLCGFDISQFKSRARSLPHFHCLRRHIPSKLF